jgi:hypothetical protein
LPIGSIQRAHIGDKIILDKYPAFAGFGPGNQSPLGFLAQFLSIHLEEVCSLGEIKRSHGYQTRMTDSANGSASTLKHGWEASGRSITERLPDTLALLQERMVYPPAAGKRDKRMNGEWLAYLSLSRKND